MHFRDIATMKVSIDIKHALSRPCYDLMLSVKNFNYTYSIIEQIITEYKNIIELIICLSDLLSRYFILKLLFL